ncbi:energy transducer TonB [Pseudomonas abieticivorans]|uniref:energy transducer TonB n=1 Tax=Pseudomonas abieticivorans TaxID=2931382 RepID=UPI0020BE3122|nr:energy transducer TonB [Pseudomonas sp. PIA16]
MDATLSPTLPLQPLPAGSATRLLRRGGVVVLVLAVHALVLSELNRPSATVPVTPVTRTIYASVINEPAPAPAASAAPTPPPPVVPVTPAPVAAVHPVARPKPVAKPQVAQHPVAPVATPGPTAISTPAAAPVVAATPAPPPQPKTLTRGVQYLREPQPQYPESAREDGHEGTVILRVLVDEHGKPGAIDVVRSSGFGNLDEAGRAAARGALFKPYLEDGHAESVYVIVPLRFQLDS